MVSHVTRVVTEARVTRHIVSYPDFAQTRLSTPGYEQYGVWDQSLGISGTSEHKRTEDCSKKESPIHAVHM